MAQQKGQLSAKQLKAAAVLVETGGSVPAAAERVGIGRRTLERWMAAPQFDAEYRRRLDQAFRQATVRLQTRAAEAVERLAALMQAEEAPAHVQCTAATAILRFGRDAVEVDRVQARLDRLEQKVSENEEQRKRETA